MGTTIAPYPTISWYMPQTSASALKFVLWDAKWNEVYQIKYVLAKSDGCVVGTPGIMSLTLPAFAGLSPLEIGQEYRWQLALIQGVEEQLSDFLADGKIKRVKSDPILTLRAQRATPQERVGLYAQRRLWYDTLSTLVELKRSRPEDKDLTAALSKLFNSVGLNAVQLDILSEERIN
jgi:hypothetical protein